MANLPYFPFYVNDWLGSTTITCLTPTQEGGLVRLLAHAWNKPGCVLSGTESDLMALSRLNSQALAGLLAKAFQSCEGGYFNARQRQIREDYESYSKSMSDAGKKGAQRKKELKLRGKEAIAKLKQSSCKGNAKDKPSITISSSLSPALSSSITPTKSESEKHLVESLRLSTLLANLILINKPDYRDLQNSTRQKRIEAWAADIEKMIRIDARAPDQIETVIVWSQKDSFWFKNILSGATLRDKFDRIEMDMKKPNRKQVDKHAGIDEWLSSGGEHAG